MEDAEHLRRQIVNLNRRIEDKDSAIISLGHGAKMKDAEITALRKRVGELEGAATTHQRTLEALRDVLRWAEARCPCRNEEPNLCPLCGASVENLEACKSAENTLPRDLLEKLRRAAALARIKETT